MKQFKSCCIHKESHKIFKYQGKFDLQGQCHWFSNPTEIFRLSMNRSGWKVKAEMVQLVKTKI